MRFRHIKIILVFLFLNSLLLLPWLYHRKEPWDNIYTVSGEILVGLVALCWFSKKRRGWVGAFFIGVLCFELTRSVGRYLMSQDPLLYDLLFLLQHLVVLIMDIWTPETLGMMVAGMLGVTVVFKLLLWNVGILNKGVQRIQRKRRFIAIIFIIATILTVINIQTRAYHIRWSTPSLISNLKKSVKVWDRVHQKIQTSPYVAYDDIQLKKKPSIQLFLVESYGRILSDHPQSNAAYHQFLQEMEEGLAKEGWHMASAFCRAPVSGGRSWLADSSLFLGIRIKYESVYRHFMQNMDKLPSLIDFLKKQGYHTTLLAPKDRARPGVQLQNYFDFAQTIFFKDLHYTGPVVGWGWIPDQYSLGYANDVLLPDTETPLFFSFHMVSSHAPWKVVPPLVDDWRTLNDESDKKQKDIKPRAEILKRMKRYRRRVATRTRYMGKLSTLKLERFTHAIYYDLAVLERFLYENTRDGVVIIMGDHQPPVINDYAKVYDVPMHIFSRDPQLLEEFFERGFVSGLVIPPNSKNAIRHEGIFSLLVRMLVHHDNGVDLPSYLHKGAQNP